jgi:hypothetical protein
MRRVIGAGGSSLLTREHSVPEATLTRMKRIGLVGVVLVLAACSFDASQEQYEALEEQARLTTEVTGESAFCEFVELAIDAGGRTPPLAYSLDVLERYDTEHC